MITRLALLAIVTAALAVPGTAGAQGASPAETQLQMERQQRRVIVRPTPSTESVERDVEAAKAETEQTQRQQEIVRDLRRPLPRRPDLDYDVKSGIQSQRLNGVLRR